MDPVLLLLAGLLVIIVLQTVRTRRVQRRTQETQSAVQVGATVVTTAGLMATVVAADEESVTLESVPGSRTRWVRAAVARVVPDEPAPEPVETTTEPAGSEGATEPTPRVSDRKVPPTTDPTD